MSEERFVAIEQRLDSIDAGQLELRAEVQDLGTQMRVLHEDTIDKIKALSPDFGPIRREFAQADQQLREDIDARLIPLEAEARQRPRRRTK